MQGAGAALLMPLGLALLSAAFPPERRGAAIGIFSAITGLAVASGPLDRRRGRRGHRLAVDLLDQRPDRRWSRSRSCSPRMRESYGPDTGLDIRGLALVTGGALGLVWGLVRGNQAGWGSPEVVGALVAGVAARRRRSSPGSCAPASRCCRCGFFRSRAFSAGNAAIFFTFASLFGAVFFYAQLLQTGLGYGPLGAGLRLLPWTATFITVAPVAGALADRIGERPLMVAGLSLQAVGHGLAGADRRARHGLLADARAVHRRRRRRLDGDPGRAELGRRLGRRRTRSARRPAPTA